MHKNIRITELMGRNDFSSLMRDGLSPLLLEGASEEPSIFESIFQTFNMTKSTIEFPSLKGLYVGKIEDGQEIPFINLGTGTQSISVEGYGVRVGFTRKMLMDDEYDLMSYTTREVGKAHTRLKNQVAFMVLEAGAGTSAASSTGGKLVLADIRAAKTAASLFTEAGTGIKRPTFFTHLIIHPNQHDDLLPAELQNLKPGIVIDPATGDIKAVSGLKIIITSWITDGVAVLVKAKDKLLFMVRAGLEMDKTENFATAVEEVRTIEYFTFAVLDGNNVYKITNC